MSADEALAYLQREMGEGWNVAIRTTPGGWYADASFDSCGIWMIYCRPDPMSAAKACVEAWREATRPLQGAFDSMSKLLGEETADHVAEREHADRLAEALRLGVDTSWNSMDAGRLAREAIAAHDARRAKPEDGSAARKERT